ncbi:MAG: ribulose-phosphate 3-epimerase [Lachnospiraceae bacterium]|jgi:ribulose-phosphate 3-epimerase|nr:ribulose-phosphate 3-epimerase [Lachnospiraceae bacterium]
MKNYLSPSILAADFWSLGEQIRAVERGGASYLHVDVMDGVFVPSISFGMPVLEALKRKTTLLLDVHLMIVEPERYIETMASMGADLINFHLEATSDPLEVIQKIRSLGKKVGITIKPATPITALYPYLELVDMVLIMTVEPGFGGQSIMMDCVEKVRQLRKKVTELGLPLDIEVDGGIKESNLEMVLEAGANVIVAGSAIFGGNPEERTRLFVEKMNVEN